MDCEDAINLISSELDGELPAGDRTALEAHLSGCESCRSTAVAMRLQDAALRRAFASRNDAAIALATRVIGELRTPTTAPIRAIPWIPVLMSAAAGFLLAVLIFRVWDRSASRLADVLPQPPNHEADRDVAHRTPPPGKIEKTPDEAPEQIAVKGPEPLPERGAPARPLTQLVFAKGAIEMLPPGSEAWRPLATGGTIEPATRVRTDAAGRCEFRTPDGSEVRLNGNTELVFKTNRLLELAQGQVWSNVADDEQPYEIQVPSAEAKVTALGTQFDLASTALATVLTVAQGTTRVEGKAGDGIVQFGEQATIVGGAIAERRRIRDLVVATSWVHEILVLKGHDDKELAKRMDEMLAQIGSAKMSFMYEKEILQLGDHCVLPLTRFIQSEQSKGDKQKRANAARILAKISQPWSVGDLIQLLADDDLEVRFHVAKALERLTDGQTQGVPADHWRDADEVTRSAALARWRTWWGDNKAAFPTPPFSTEQIVKDKPDESLVPRRTKS
jgi:hypothetical protein